MPLVGPDVGGLGVVRRAFAITVASSGGLVPAEQFGTAGAEALVESDQESQNVVGQHLGGQGVIGDRNPVAKVDGGRHSLMVSAGT